MNNRWLRHTLWGVAVIFAALITANLGFRCGYATAPHFVAEPEVFFEEYAEPMIISEMLDEYVKALVFTDQNVQLIAQRIAPLEGFAVHIVFSSASEALFCKTSADLNGLLPRLTSILATKQLPQDELLKRFPAKAGTLTFVTPLFPEEDCIEFYTDAHGENMGILSYGRYSYEITTPTPAILAALRNICQKPVEQKKE